MILNLTSYAADSWKFLKVTYKYYFINSNKCEENVSEMSVTSIKKSQKSRTRYKYQHNYTGNGI